MRQSWLALALLVSCGDPPPARAPEGPADTEPKPHPLAGMTVYDAAGQEHACEEPRRDCPPVAPNPDFEESCRTAGYRVQLCGCESMCTGKVDKRYYDAEGNQKPCPPQGECAPPPASAAFQDACTDRGFHLQACGCEEWLCSGDPTK